MTRAAFQSRPSPHADREDGERGDDQLHAAKAEHEAAHDPEPLRRQLESDHEQHQDDAELGDVRDLLGVADQIQCRRPDQGAGGEIAEHRAKARALGQRHRDHRREQQDHGVLHEATRFHGSLR